MRSFQNEARYEERSERDELLMRLKTSIELIADTSVRQNRHDF